MWGGNVKKEVLNQTFLVEITSSFLRIMANYLIPVCFFSLLFKMKLIISLVAPTTNTVMSFDKLVVVNIRTHSLGDRSPSSFQERNLRRKRYVQASRSSWKGSQLEMNCLSFVVVAPTCNIYNNNFIISKLVKKLDDESLKNPGRIHSENFLYYY